VYVEHFVPEIQEMKNNRKVIRTSAILALLVLSWWPISRTASALNPGPPADKTSLDVRLPGAQPQWGNLRTIHALHSLTFRWKTDIPMSLVDHGRWQVFDYKPQPNGMNETPFHISDDQLPLLPAGSFKDFSINFAHLQHLYPNKIPANAPANGKDYWIRVVPWNSDETMTGRISDVVKITYAKSPPPPPDPPTFDYAAVFWTGGHYVNLGYGTNKSVMPLVTVSTFAPTNDAQGNPTFSNHKPVFVSLPFLSGYEKDGEVELRNLTPKTHYHYIIQAKDEKGQFAYQTGEFTTATRVVDIYFEKVFMIDDSDNFPSGGADMNFAFFINGENVMGKSKTLPDSQEQTIHTGESWKFPLTTFYIKDPDNKIDLRVNGRDDDGCKMYGPIAADCHCDTGSVTNPRQQNMQNPCAEYAIAMTTLNIPDVTWLDPKFGIETVNKPFTMEANNGNLKYRIFGSFFVRYH
jgi:hypothetical protein